MPIYQCDLARGSGTRSAQLKASPRSNLVVNEDSDLRELSEENLGSESDQDSLVDPPTRNYVELTSPSKSASHRTELIEKLKRGKNPSWNSGKHLNAHDLGSFSPSALISPSLSTALLPALEISETKVESRREAEQNQTGLEIERPRSALHSGDFTERSGSDDYVRSALETDSYKNPQLWLSTSPPLEILPYKVGTRLQSQNNLEQELALGARTPSLSSSLSNFVLKPPTSPLVQSLSNDEGEFTSKINPIDIDSAYQRNRRHILQALHSTQPSPSVPTVSSTNNIMLSRRDTTNAYQAHQPRRSLTSNIFSNISSSPQTPVSRSRKASFTSESSPLHAAMVGSYEESILRGRMSTTPSKPLNFLAQIGVLGLGKCKSSLRCPAHVTIPFPAVFYSYETTSHGRAGKYEDGPSPYVGQIDLENNLTNQEDTRENKRKRYDLAGHGTMINPDMVKTSSTQQVSEQEIRRVEKQKRRASSPKAPPGGSYRIPEKGQLQIIVKNPNKTAVKLFLVPYDLVGMEPGTKTFVRQRSYSTGPIIDSALSSSPQITSTTSLDRPTLRYLVHIHICCPARGRYYLYKSIRIVFANRVPDGKEKLRNEISLPEPKFSMYKPGREFGNNHAVPGSIGANLTADKAYRRRSSGFHLTASRRGLDNLDGIGSSSDQVQDTGMHFGHVPGLTTVPVKPIPLTLFQPSGADEFGPQAHLLDNSSNNSSLQPTSQGIASTSMSWDSDSTDPGIQSYGKLNKGDIGYGGNVFLGPVDGNQVVAEGLLAKKLRDLGVGMSNIKGDEKDES